MKVVVFDLDGTLLNIEHRVHHVRQKPKNWKAFNSLMHLDTPYEDMVEFLDSFWADFGPERHKIIFCTAREEVHRGVTEESIKKHIVPVWDGLYMRKEKDYRSDAIVKVELLQEIRKDHGNPWLWIDDRDRVVNALRENGIRVLQCRNGDF